MARVNFRVGAVGATIFGRFYQNLACRPFRSRRNHRADFLKIGRLRAEIEGGGVNVITGHPAIIGLKQLSMGLFYSLAFAF